MKLRDILKDIDITELNVSEDVEITGIEYDSRKVKPGSLFVAIRGYETDGNLYAAAALKNGAAAVISDKASKKYKNKILVKDARRALATASKNFFGNPIKDIKMIGVTGTNGKTTITYLIKQVLEAEGAKCGLIGTNQNMIGDVVLPSERTTPESRELWQMFSDMKAAGCTHIIMEASSHSLFLSRVHGIEFDVGIFTNLTQDHLDFHKTFEKYAEAKFILFDNSKTGVVNYDDETGKKLLKSGKTEFVSFSAQNDEATYVAKSIKLLPASVEFVFVGMGIIERISLAIPGMFSVYNCMAAISALLTLGVPLPKIAEHLKTVHGVKGRAEVVKTDTEYTVMIDYAHSPDGLENILNTVKEITRGRTICVFGCGGDRDKTKRPKMGAIAVNIADVAIITSDNPRTEDPDAIIDDIMAGVGDKKNYERITDRRAAIFRALSIAKAGDTVVLAGKGHETYQEINHVKNHMDEREIVAEYYEARK